MTDSYSETVDNIETLESYQNKISTAKNIGNLAIEVYNDADGNIRTVENIKTDTNIKANWNIGSDENIDTENKQWALVKSWLVNPLRHETANNAEKPLIIFKLTL